jgi:hypothetical protein
LSWTSVPSDSELERLKEESRGLRETSRSIWETLGTTEPEIVNVRHATLDFHLALPGLVASMTLNSMCPDLLDTIARIRTILKYATNPTPSLKKLKLIRPLSWQWCLKHVMSLVYCQKATEEGWKKIDEFKQWIITEGDLPAGFLSKLNNPYTSVI